MAGACLAKLAFVRVWAIGTSKRGRTGLGLYFHSAYGFLRLQYRDINLSRVDLELAAVGIRSPSMEELVGIPFSRLSQ